MWTCCRYTVNKYKIFWDWHMHQGIISLGNGMSHIYSAVISRNVDFTINTIRISITTPFPCKNACILIQIQSVRRNTLRAQTSVMPGLSVKLSIQVWDSLVKVAQKSKKRNPRDIDLDISPTWKFHEMLLIAFPLIFLTDIHPSQPTPKIEKNCMLVTIMLVKGRQTDR